jgi:hypothetical protein
LKKSILLLGAGLEQVLAIWEAKQIGLKVIACDENPRSRGLKEADVGIVCDIKDIKHLVEIGRQYESFARLNHTSDFNIMKKNFRFRTQKINFDQIKPILRKIRLIFSQMLPQIEAIRPVFYHRAQLSIYTGRTSKILDPFFKLKANCRNMISIVFLSIFGNRVLFPLSCKWLMPK